MKILIIHFESKGLLNDAVILHVYIKNLFDFIKKPIEIEIRSTAAPGSEYVQENQSLTYPGETKPDLVIHIQDVYEIRNISFQETIHILVPNPEWTNQHTAKRISSLNEVWHKTKYIHRAFIKAFPGLTKVEHFHLGFTTLDVGLEIHNFDSFAHFRGAGVARGTDKIFDIWKRKPDYPLLRVKFHSYDRSLGFLSTLSWFRVNNIEIKYGFSPSDEEYFSDFVSSGGLHLCTSEMEGFGHYINESRMLGAVPIVINGYPMSEMVDIDSGYLIEPSETVGHNLSLRYKITEEDLEKTIDAVISTPITKLQRLGQNARKRYLEDRSFFYLNLHIALQRIFQKKI
jgi:hypothetical protein